MLAMYISGLVFFFFFVKNAGIALLLSVARSQDALVEVFYYGLYTINTSTRPS